MVRPMAGVVATRTVILLPEAAGSESAATDIPAVQAVAGTIAPGTGALKPWVVFKS